MSPESSGKTASSHTDKAFESDLRQVREKLLAMGAKVEEQIAKSMRSLTDRDSELGEQVKEADVEVNRLEVDIDELCRKILALRQPAARDLRLITTALKIVTDLERIGDLAVNIAERAMDLNQAPPLARLRGPAPAGGAGAGAGEEGARLVRARRPGGGPGGAGRGRPPR